MISIDPQASLKYFRSIQSHTERDVERRLDRFQRSLETCLHSALNWPQEDWEADLRLFVEHTRYAGWEISPHSLAEIRKLLAARAGRSGLFAPSRAETVEREPIQLAQVMISPSQDTDATLDLGGEGDGSGEPTVEPEVAGPGPDVSLSFKTKVRYVLELLDPAICRWWHAPSVEGLIQSRDAWGPRRNVMSYVEKDRPIVVVDQTFNAGDTALAIIDEATSGLFADSIGVHLRKYKIGRSRNPDEFAAWRKESAKEAAAEAAVIAELYYGALASLTPAGDLIVTIDDVDRNGVSLSHALILLPGMALFRGKIKGFVLKIAGGKQLRVSGELLKKLGKLPKETLEKLVAKVRRAKTQKDAIDILEKGTKGKLPAKAKPSPKKPTTKPSNRPTPKGVKSPGEWRNMPENMRDRARTYQTQITGKKNQVYLVQGVKFDGYKNGVLIECKGPGYLDFVRKSDGTFYYWFAASELEQARRQLTAAAGAPIEWIVAEPELKLALENLFELHNITGIPIRVVPAR
jgi:hypothetical protein